MKINPELFYGRKYMTNDNWKTKQHFLRTIGSKHQKLVKINKTNKTKNNIFIGTVFYIVEDTITGNRYFSKRILQDPFKQMREFVILENVEHPNAIKLKYVHEKYGLVFPYLSGWKCLPKVNFKRVKNANQLLTEIIGFFEYASRKYVKVGCLDLDLTDKKEKRRLIDIIDLHGNNFLVKIKKQEIIDWRVVDMEYYSNKNMKRNLAHLQKIKKLLIL